ncbi:MAG: response regulator transcription factor [Chitinophagaceae bacterium]|nr:response regulator transcription factor [Chitinophagaceae bacterium]
MNSSQILIAEDHPLIVRGITHILNLLTKEHEIVVTDNGKDFFELATKIQPKYCIVDLHLTDGLSLGKVEALLKMLPECHVMIYTSFPGPVYAKRLFRLGIHGFLNKMAKESELKNALSKFLADDFYVSQDFLPQIFNKQKTFDIKKINPFEFLSSKELSLIEYLRQGMQIKDIAEQMEIKPNTAATYKKRAFEKLDIENVVQLNHLYQQYEDQITTDIDDNDSDVIQS